MLLTQIGSGQISSPGITLARAGAHAVLVSSGAAAAIWPEFAPQSGTGFAPLFRADGAGTFAYVTSGAMEAVGIIPKPPGPWMRIAVASATANDVRSLTILPIR